jgi:hypothetical protein
VKNYSGIFFIFLCISVIFTAGCTRQTEPAASAPVPVITHSVTPPTAIFTATVTTVTAVPPISTAGTSDPILHRWVRKYMFKVNGQESGYEFKFYPDGTVNYKIGSATMVFGNIEIITPLSEASGTWTKLEEKKYLIEILPTSGARIYRVYTLVPAYADPKYPGVTFTEHIESSYETDDIMPGQVHGIDEMYFPERAKID